jgi:hypothetical protein
MEIQPKHIYDDEKNWTVEGIWKPPSTFDAAKYQKRLDQIFGLSPSGESICRVRWAWQCQRWENVEWDDFGNAIKGEWRQKYRALTVEIGNDEYVDISPPRWVLEERFEPGQYARSWELTRYTRPLLWILLLSYVGTVNPLIGLTLTRPSPFRFNAASVRK